PLPVTYRCRPKLTLAVVAPVTRFTVPVDGVVNVLTLHAESPPFGTGTGGPIGQAVSSDRIQPISPVLRLKRLTAPSGSADGATVLAADPRARSPQSSGIRTVPPPSRTSPQVPVPVVLANSIVSGGNGRSVVPVVVVGGTDVDVLAPVVEVVLGAVVDVVVELVPLNSCSTTVPARLAAPGPGREAPPSISTLPV